MKTLKNNLFPELVEIKLDTKKVLETVSFIEFVEQHIGARKLENWQKESLDRMIKKIHYNSNYSLDNHSNIDYSINVS